MTRRHSSSEATASVAIDLDRARELEAKLIRVARSIVRCPYLAEDIVQDVYVKLLASERDREVSSLEAFLVRMVRNLAIDRTRQLKVERALFGDAEEGVRCPAAAGQTPESCLMSCQALCIVEEALKGLPDRLAEAFYLHRVEGIAQKDIAEEMGVSKSLICAYISRGEQHCRLALEKPADAASKTPAAKAACLTPKP